MTAIARIALMFYKSFEAATPLLVCMAAGFFILWLVMLCCKADHRWEWKVSHMNGAAVTAFVCATTGPHRVYTVIDNPVSPWVANGRDSQNPWADALELACTWTAGAGSKHLVATLVTDAINESGRFAYETGTGGARYVLGHTVFLSSCIDRMKGYEGMGRFVNCTDCASFVVSFSNILGCELYSSRMGFKFNTNPYSAIGCVQWTPPQWGWGFSYHEVAWSGQCGDEDMIYDACLKYDGDSDPTASPRIAELPAGVQFSDGNSATPFMYRERLAAPGTEGYDRCVSRPLSKTRREVK